jgi:hypothetical protein
VNGRISFSKVLGLLESHGWFLHRIHPPYRVFYKNGDVGTGLPILVEVHDHEVDEDYVAEIIRSVQKAEE